MNMHLNISSIYTFFTLIFIIYITQVVVQYPYLLTSSIERTQEASRLLQQSLHMAPADAARVLRACPQLAVTPTRMIADSLDVLADVYGLDVYDARQLVCIRLLCGQSYYVYI